MNAARVDERRASGRARREHAPRSAHAGWSPPVGRPDPVDVLVAADADRLPELVPIRHARMAVSAFTFFRGTAEIMAADLASTPATGVETQLCGDAHLLNFGLFATPERNLVFDLNDFDETTRGPWEWDLKRLATSFEVAGRDEAMSRPQRPRRCGPRCAPTASDSPPTPGRARSRSATTGATSPRSCGSRPTRARRKQLVVAETKARRRDSEHALTRLAALDGDRYRIVDDPPLVFHPDDPDWEHTTAEFMDAYRASLRPEIRVVVDRYRLVDGAAKVVGVGSVGTRCFVALLLSDDDAPLFLQAKEAGPSALAHARARERAGAPG